MMAVSDKFLKNLLLFLLLSQGSYGSSLSQHSPQRLVKGVVGNFNLNMVYLIHFLIFERNTNFWMLRGIHVLHTYLQGPYSVSNSLLNCGDIWWIGKSPFQLLWRVQSHRHGKRWRKKIITVHIQGVGKIWRKNKISLFFLFFKKFIFSILGCVGHFKFIFP